LFGFICFSDHYHHGRPFGRATLFHINKHGPIINRLDRSVPRVPVSGPAFWSVPQHARTQNDERMLCQNHVTTTLVIREKKKKASCSCIIQSTREDHINDPPHALVKQKKLLFLFASQKSNSYGQKSIARKLREAILMCNRHHHMMRGAPPRLSSTHGTTSWFLFQIHMHADGYLHADLLNP
jgi:hypothetical protein